MGSPILRAVAIAAAAAASMGVATCLANPMPADEAAAQVAAPAAAPLAMPAASTSPASPGRANAAQERADAMATARDPSLLPIDMQGVGAQAHPAPSALPSAQSLDPAGDNEGFRKFATSARDWMRDVFGRPDNSQGNPSGDALPGAPGAAGDLGLPVETQSSGVRVMPQRAERPIEVPAPGAGPHRATAAAAPPRESAGAKVLAESAPEYSIQQFLKRCREVLVHPLTWLAIVAIGASHLAMNRGKR